VVRWCTRLPSGVRDSRQVLPAVWGPPTRVRSEPPVTPPPPATPPGEKELSVAGVTQKTSTCLNQCEHRTTTRGRTGSTSGAWRTAVAVRRSGNTSRTGGRRTERSAPTCPVAVPTRLRRLTPSSGPRRCSRTPR
jgi:hypothetical protein